VAKKLQSLEGKIASTDPLDKASAKHDEAHEETKGRNDDD
jgi:hypothetical protein